MRVDQIITLVWTANVLLLGGTGWVGWKFWEQKKAPPPPKTVEWPEVGARPTPSRWPGDESKFRELWDVQINGLVPPPPKAAEPVKAAPVDPATAFRNRYTIEAGFPSTYPWGTVLQVKDSQKASTVLLVPGESLDDWKLVQVDINLATGACRAGFSNPAYEKGILSIEQKLPAFPDVAKAGDPTPFVPEYPSDSVARKDAVKREVLTVQAYKDSATGEWWVPDDETTWMEIWGESEILSKTKFKERPEGLEISTRPPRAALDSTRDFDQGDVVVSINGTPVRTLADVTNYLRGAGRGLARYEVVVERDGARRTQVYNVQRSRRAAATGSSSRR